ncbi:MAG: hypothetical protein ACFB5Z_07215 [Elainellaceae cyanobacterium]
MPNRPIPQYAIAQRRPRSRRSQSAPPSPSALQVRGAVALAPVPQLHRPSAAAASPPIAARSPVATFTGRRRRYPKGLQALILAQRSSFICASAITAIALTLYGWTVYSQQRWSNLYSRSELLQLQEQQLRTATGAFEAQILQPSEAASELQPLKPEDVVELSPTAPRPALAEPAAPQAFDWTVPQPIGY